MAFATSDMGAAQDASPKDFTVCEKCNKKGKYRQSTIIGSTLYTYDRCRYCKRSELVYEEPVKS